MSARSPFALASLALVLAGLVPGTAAAQWRPPATCSVVNQNLFVRDVMADIYYWYTEIPRNTNAASFSSPDAYLEAIRYRALDSTFSYIGSATVEQAFYSDSQYIGFGFASSYNGVELRVAQVFPESPAAEAGMQRGDTFVSINGRSIASLAEAGVLGSAFGPGEEGYQSEIVFRHPTGEPIQATLTKRIITIPTVTQTQVYALEDGRKVGYVFFRNFVEPSVAALDEAFAQLRAAEVSELVLDLRYNGGGLVSVAQHLASLIGGKRTDGQLLATYYHNDRNTFRNRDIRFDPKDNALMLDRVVVVTTRSTASASELVVNALRPFIPVVTVGETSYGKPVGMYGISFCDKVLYPVAFSLRNANNEGDYFGGFEPTCPALDDIEHQLGDAREGSLAEALTFLATGACTPKAAETSRVLARRSALPKATGFQALVNAH